MAARPPTRILVAEDDPDIGSLLEHYLKKAGFLPAVVASGRDVMPQIKRDAPDLVVLDLMLPGLDGLQVCRAIRADAHTAAIPIIMLTAKAEESDRIVGLELGADDYITKPFGLSELRSRVRAVLRRASMGAPAAGEPDVAVLDEAGVRLDRGRRAVAVDGADVDLTYVEFEILTTLMESPGRVYSRAQLLDAVWGSSDFREPRTVDVHVRHLREKIEADPASPVRIHTVRGIGYRFEG